MKQLAVAFALILSVAVVAPSYAQSAGGAATTGTQQSSGGTSGNAASGAGDSGTSASGSKQ